MKDEKEALLIPDSSFLLPPSSFPWWPLLTAGLILTAAGLHVAYFASGAALDLAPDEAHYWDWSRHLDWSYYSKGPLVAYLIRLGCALAGPWSERLIATDMLAVRLPATVCGSLLLVSLYVLTIQVYANPRLACAVVALALTLPVLAAGATLMTIDAPYTCCWGWALVFGYQAAVKRSAWAWPAAGLAVGLGILAKYTMVLWLPSLGLFLLTSAAHRRLLLRPGFWVAVGVAFVCSLPIVGWNARHGWVTFRHVGGQAGMHETVHWLGPLHFVAVQFALLLGYWFVVWAAAMVQHRPWREADVGVRYLWWMSAPMFLTFFLFGFKTGGGEANWPITAYVSGLVLAVAWLAEQLRAPAAGYRRLTAWGLTGAGAVGVALILVMHLSAWARPALARLAGPPTAAQPFPLRRLDPTCRLRGWRYLAAEVDQIRSALRREGIEPLVACASWSLPGEIGFYCEGHPTVYSLGLILGDRHSQYDFWRPNPLADAAAFRGWTIIYIGGVTPDFARAFECVEPTRRVTYQEHGDPIACWDVTVCRGYRGFPNGNARAGHY
jgi:hypothetical protein